jgi:triphosphatase
MSTEIELKLLIAERDIYRLQRLPMLNAVTLKKLPGQHLNSIYYDTIDYRLRDRGIAVRLRQVGNKWLQTIKTEGRVIAGLHERPEWEMETTPNTLDFSRLPDAKLKALLRETLGDEPLRPAFVTDFRRQRRVLQFNDGSQCEFSLDRGKIFADGNEAAIAELELEMTAGDPLMLFDFAYSLLEHMPVTLAHDSKAARGFALAGGTAITPIKAKPAALDKHMSMPQGFVAIATSCVVHMTANEAGCTIGADAEYLHQMRVAVRRLRTALRLFSDHLDAEKMSVLGEELRWLGGALGTTRDLDVFLDETLPPVLAAWPDRPGLLRLRETIVAQREVAMATSRAAIRSARYQRLLLDIGAWLVAMTRPTLQPHTVIGLAEFAREVLKRQRKQLIQRAHRLLQLSAEERHRVRISGKRLRYAAEFLTSLFPEKRCRAYIDELANLQSILGVLNDAATTKTLLSQVTDDTNRDDLAILQAWGSGVCQGHLTHLPQAYDRFLQQPTFW